MLKVTADNTTNPDGKVLEAEVDQDLRAFDLYFQALGNDPLVGSEKASIKTYLHYKLKAEPALAASAGTGG